MPVLTPAWVCTAIEGCKERVFLRFANFLGQGAMLRKHQEKGDKGVCRCLTTVGRKLRNSGVGVPLLGGRKLKQLCQVGKCTRLPEDVGVPLLRGRKLGEEAVSHQ